MTSKVFVDPVKFSAWRVTSSTDAVVPNGQEFMYDPIKCPERLHCHGTVDREQGLTMKYSVLNAQDI